MGYIKKLKNNELVGGTDKTTIYPVTSTEAVFEEVIEDGESNFKSQKFLNNNITGDRINKETITDYNIAVGTVTKGKLTPQVQTMLDEGQKKALTPKGNYNLETEYEALDLVFDPVTNSSYISLVTPNVGHPVDENAEGYEEGWWEKTLDGTAVNTAQATINDKVDELVEQVDDAIEQARQDLQDATNAANNAAQYATQTTDDKVAWVDEQVDSLTAYEVSPSLNTTSIVPTQTKVVAGALGYFTCETLSGTALKEVVNPYGYALPTNGGAMKIKMINANTAANATLKIGTETAKPLFYNGERASATNSWDANEVISVYYDGTNYQASNSQGGSNKKIDAYLLGDLRILETGRNYDGDEAVKTTDKQLKRVVNTVASLSLSEPLAVGELKTANNTTYRSESAINAFNPSTEYTEGAYALGSMTIYTLTVSAENINAGNITVNGTDVAIETTDDAATIASKISSALNIEGWTDSASDNVITVRCNTIGNNTTTITITDTDGTGVVVDGISTPSETGTNVIRKYDGESWATAVVSDLITDGILVEVDATWLLTNNTEQNSVQKDISSIVSNRIGNISKEVSISFAKTTKSQWQYTNNGVVAVNNNNWTRSTNYIDVSNYYSVKLAFVGLFSWSEISTFFTDDNNRMIGTEPLNESYDYKEFIVPEGATRLYYSTRTATWSTFAAKGVIEPTVVELLDDINADIVSTTEKLDDRTLTQDALSINNYGLRNCIIAVGSKKWYSGTNTYHRIIPIGNYKAFAITANSTEADGAYYGFLKDATVNIGESPIWASGESALRNVPIGQTITTKDVPEDANYLYIHCTNKTQTYQPDAISGILELKYAVDDINNSIDELEEVKTAVLGTGNISYTGEKINLRTSYSLSMKKLFNVFNSGVSMQGAAVYGDKLFQFYVGGTCYVYNLLDGSLIESFTMSALSTAHLGSPHFSKTFRNEGDEYPLLYVNGQDALGTGVICDYIVIDINGKADAEIVNSVTLEGFGIQSVCNAFDFDNGIGYSICGSSIVQPFKLSDSSWDINDRIKYKNMGHIQDAVYCNGYIYINTGWYTNNETVKILGINVAEKRMSTVVDLGNANRESEGLSIYNNKLIMTIKGLNAAYEINPG